MNDVFISPHKKTDYEVDCTDWEWVLDEQSLNKTMVEICQENAEMALGEYIDGMTVNMDRNTDILVSSEAVENAFMSFDLQDIVKGLIVTIEDNYAPQYRDKNKEETIKWLNSVRLKLQSCVDLIDNSIESQKNP